MMENREKDKGRTRIQYTRRERCSERGEKGVCRMYKEKERTKRKKGRKDGRNKGWKEMKAREKKQGK